MKKITLNLYISDHCRNFLQNAKATVYCFSDKKCQTLEYNTAQRCYSISLYQARSYYIRIEHAGFETHERIIETKEATGSVQAVGRAERIIRRQSTIVEDIVLGKKGMPFLNTGKRQMPLATKDNELMMMSDQTQVDLTAEHPAELERLNRKYDFELRSQSDSCVHHGFKRLKMNKPLGRNTKNQLKADLLNSNLAKEVGEEIVEDGDGLALLTNRIIVCFSGSVEKKSLLSLLEQMNIAFVTTLEILPGYALLEQQETTGDDIANAVNALQSSGLFSSVEPVILSSSESFALYPPTNFLYPMQWSLPIMKVPEAWEELKGYSEIYSGPSPLENDITYGKASIIIGLLDFDGVESTSHSGSNLPAAGQVEPLHEDLKGNVSDSNSKAYYFCDFEYGKYDNSKNIGNVRLDHGVNCLGVMSARTKIGDDNPVSSDGIVGIAANTKFISTIPGKETTSFINSYLWTCGVTTLPNPNFNPIQISPAADIITCSGSKPSLGTVVYSAINTAVTYGRFGRGSLSFQAVGNSYDNITKPYATHNYQALAEKSIPVGASTLTPNGRDEVAAPYSNHGDGLELVAPSHSKYLNDDIIHDPPDSFGFITLAKYLQTKELPIRGNLPGNTDLIEFQLVEPATSGDLELMLPANLELFDHDANLYSKAILFGDPSSLSLSNFNNYPLESRRLTEVNKKNDQWVVTFDRALKKHHPIGTKVFVGKNCFKDDSGGTSIATPEVAAVAALVLSVNPTLSWVEVRQILRDSADKIDFDTVFYRNMYGENLGDLWNIARYRDKYGRYTVSDNSEFIALDFGQSVNLTQSVTIHSTEIKVDTTVDIEHGQTINIHDVEIDPTTNETTDKTELRVVNDVYDQTTLYVDPLKFSHSAGKQVELGRVAHHSPVYGYGRVNAHRAVLYTFVYYQYHRGIMIRDTSSDDGKTATTVDITPIHSPDIGTIKSNDPISKPGKLTTAEIHKVPSFETYQDIKPVKSASGLDDNPGFFVSGTYTGTTGTNNQPSKYHIRFHAPEPRPGTSDTSSETPVETYTFWKDEGDESEKQYVFIKNVPLPLAEGVYLTFPSENPAFVYEVGSEYIIEVIANTRYVCARVFNQQENDVNITNLHNLDCYVRFYVALTDSIEDDWPIFPKDWQGPAVYDPMSGIVTSQKKTYFLGETKIEEGCLGPGDHLMVTTHWKQNALPAMNDFETQTAGTSLRTFLLVHLSPFDGPMAGSTVQNNKKLSYREILFSEVLFKELSSDSLLDSKLVVSQYSETVQKEFRIDVRTHIGHFDVDFVQIEFTRFKKDGSKEQTKFWKKESWLFTFADAEIALEPPINPETGMTVEGKQIQVFFNCSLAVSQTDAKFAFKIHLFSPRNESDELTVLLSEHDVDLDVVMDTSLPAGATTTAAGGKAKPCSHAFVDFKFLNQATEDRYGPISKTIIGDGGKEETVSDQYRTTSLFTSTKKVNAYAIVSGLFIIQPLDEEEYLDLPDNLKRVNLVLKPWRQPLVNFTPVKYFIYRGLRLVDFLKVTENQGGEFIEVAPKSQSNSELLQQLHLIFEKQNNLDASPTPIFHAKMIGYDGAQLDSKPLDSMFTAFNESFQLPFVKEGMQLGEFLTESQIEGLKFGLEIVLEGGPFIPTLSFVRRPYYSVKDPQNDENPFLNKVAKEEILSFMDPAAFYGMHAIPGGSVTVRTDAADAKKDEKLSGDKIFSLIVDKFASKHCVYVDIRNENTHSYNFYGNYHDQNDQQLKIAYEYQDNTPVSLNVTQYATLGWPILIHSEAQSISSDHNTLYLQLRMDDNSEPMLYVDYGSVMTKSSRGRFVEGVDIKKQDCEWTKVVGFEFPNTVDDHVPSKKYPTANTIRIIWGRQAAADPWPSGVVPTNQFTDNVFGPVNLLPSWRKQANIRWTTQTDKKYVSLNSLFTAPDKFGYIAKKGIAFEGIYEPGVKPELEGRVLLYAIAEDFYFTFLKDYFSRIEGITHGINQKKSLFESLFLSGLRLNVDKIIEGENEVRVLNLVSDGTERYKPPESALLLGINGKQLNSLLEIADHLQFPHISLEQIDSETSFGIAYTKHNLFLSGYSQQGDSGTRYPAEPISVYSVDRFLYFSEEFSAGESIATIYLRNTEEITGLEWLTDQIPVCEDHHIELDCDDAEESTFHIVTHWLDQIANQIANDENAKTSLQTLIDQKAPLLLQRNRYLVNKNVFANPDDRILYWARLKMGFSLKNHPLLLQSTKTRYELIRSFERKSRGYEVVNYQVPIEKRVLLIGFDPFKLNVNVGTNHFPTRANPAGAAALALHDTEILDGFNLPIGRIKSLVFPVRYANLGMGSQKGIVEEILEPYVNPSHPEYCPVGAIIVLGMGRPFRFDLIRFVGRIRSGIDNEQKSLNQFPILPAGDQYYECSLPAKKIFDIPKGDLEPFDLYFNQCFYYEQPHDYKNEKTIKKYDDHDNKDWKKIGADYDLPAAADQSRIKALVNPNSNFVYIDDEVAYRLSALIDRYSMSASIQTGLLKLPRIQKQTDWFGEYTIPTDQSKKMSAKLSPVFNDHAYQTEIVKLVREMIHRWIV